ncbi:hypothetical protein HDV06_000002 [Boothiomyces sp. JEL0866]|nr:hypothetical protein HDV06_000002 [Boothiomyces sp. JEL0866]
MSVIILLIGIALAQSSSSSSSVPDWVSWAVIITIVLLVIILISLHLIPAIKLNLEVLKRFTFDSALPIDTSVGLELNTGKFKTCCPRGKYNVAVISQTDLSFNTHGESPGDLFKPFDETFDIFNTGKLTLAKFCQPKLEHQLFELNHDYLIDLRFDKVSAIFSFVTRDFFVESAKQFWPLRFTLYASGALYLSGNQIPKGICDRIELASVYLQKAATFNFYENNSHNTILTLAQLAFSYLRLDRKEAYLYAYMGLVFAKHLGINTEAGLVKISPFDYERENIRRIWWLLYHLYAMNPRKFGDGSVICPADNQIFLPSSLYFESDSHSDYYGIEIMTSTEWYIPSIPDRDFQAYRIILHKIQLNILNYVHLELLNETCNIRYIAGALDASLRTWYDNTIGIVKNHAFKVRCQIVDDPELTWLVMAVHLMHNNARIELIIPNFMKNIIKGRKAQNSLYFNEAVEAAIDNTLVLELITTYNPAFEHLNAYIIYLLFVCAFLLQCCIKVPNVCTERIVNAYERHLDLLALHGKAFQRTSLYYNLILHLDDLDIYQAVLVYGEFRAKGFSLLGKPTKNHIEMFENMSIKD